MDSALKDFVKKHDYLICVDSDGCVMDTMTCKHMHCFGPCLVDEWGLESWEEDVLHLWNNACLFRLTRGINRFKALSVVLEQIHKKYTPIVGLSALQEWVANTKALSNESLAACLEQTEDEDSRICLQKALLWSREANEAIDHLPIELKQPVYGAREALKAAARFADIAVVTSANRDAVQEEWNSYGLMKYARVLLAQDSGSKSHCIAKLMEYGYEKEHVLMIGDAVGDARAAEKNGVWFYPVLVNWEEESWDMLRQTYLEAFYRGEYGAYQEEKKQVFLENLGG